MGRKKEYRQKRLEQVHSLKSKSLYGLIIGEFTKKHNMSQNEAEVVANYCYRYVKSFVNINETQITYEIIDGVDNHARCLDTDKKTKNAFLNVISHSDIELFEEFGIKEMQINRVLRLIEQAYYQGGLLDYSRACLLVPMTKRTLRKRMTLLWENGIRCPLSGMNSKYKKLMSDFRQTRALKRYLNGHNLIDIRQDLYLSKTDWESIYCTFSNVVRSNKSITDMSKIFNLPKQLIIEYLEIYREFDISRILNKAQNNRTPASVINRENFIDGLEKFCGFFPALADKVERTLRELIDELSSVKRNNNEIIYYAISDHEPAGKPLAECELVPVCLEFITNDDKEIFLKDNISSVKWERSFRYSTQVRYQGGLLNQIDLAFLIGVSPAVLQRLIKEHENIILPTRGNMVDMGPSVSHADDIISFFMQGYTETQITNKTGHTYKSIERYIDSFIKVVGLLEFEGLTPAEIRKVLDCSRKIVNKYLDLYHKYNTAEYQWFMDYQVRRVYKVRSQKKSHWG